MLQSAKIDYRVGTPIAYHNCRFWPMQADICQGIAASQAGRRGFDHPRPLQFSLLIQQLSGLLEKLGRPEVVCTTICTTKITGAEAENAL